MDLPQMIVFDYGQTLLDELTFDPVEGTRAVLRYAVVNPGHVDAQEVQELADSLNAELSRSTRKELESLSFEIPNTMFERYLYEYLGIELSLAGSEVEKVFLDNSTPAAPTPGVAELLAQLDTLGIRTGVFSNNAFSGAAIAERLAFYLPEHRFDFILTSSDYIFRKPHPRAFDIILRKAGLPPEALWYCGDDVVCDIEGASWAGIFPVWYKGAKKHQQTPPTCAHLAIDSWPELTEILLSSNKRKNRL